jgi:hypothetical protein
MPRIVQQSDKRRDTEKRLILFGFATGISVMLFSFGPAVFFLFVARWKHLHPAE